jgi:GNAT superfamily N-acetyltransferase
VADFSRVVIREAAEADASAVGDLIDAMEEHYLGPGRSEGAAAATRMVQQAIRVREGTRFALAFSGARAVGVACWVVIRPGDRLQGLIFLKDLFVLPEVRGGGVGREMMRWLAREAIKLGIGRIDLTTDETNLGAAKLYDSLGAERQPKVMFRYDRERLERLAMGEPPAS